MRKSMPGSGTPVCHNEDYSIFSCCIASAFFEKKSVFPCSLHKSVSLVPSPPTPSALGQFALNSQDVLLWVTGVDVPTMHLYNALRRGKTDAASAAALGVRRVPPIEALKQCIRFTIRQCIHRVFHRQTGLPPYGLKRNGDASATVGVLHGIVQEHHKQLFQRLTVSAKEQGRRVLALPATARALPSVHHTW